MENPWLDRRVVGFAHQGGALEGPPNTIEAMRRAREAGASSLEFDVHRTRDGHLVLQHDPEIVVGGRTMVIAAHDLVELRAAQADLATLDEALTGFPTVPLGVEIKALDAAGPAAQRLAAEVDARPLIVSAFSPRTLRAVRSADARLETSPAWPATLAFWLASRVWLAPPLGKGHVALQVSLRLGQLPVLKKIPAVRRLRLADRRLVRAAHRRGYAVHVWTLNDEETMREAIDIGADGIFTDRPSVLTGVLSAANLRWSAS
jgi:glycerophosphoryl diester phosphodiesterase